MLLTHVELIDEVIIFLIMYLEVKDYGWKRNKCKKIR
jgi:hypothetical protein